MSGVTQLLFAIDHGDPAAASRLLPLVYDELRRLAARRLSREKPGQTLSATALVHEAYLRLVASPQSPPSQGGNKGEVQWDGRRHFFAAAAEAMRRILVENARRKKRLNRGGDFQRVDLQQADARITDDPVKLLALNEALDLLGREDPRKVELVKLRFFAGLSVEEAADCLGISRATAHRHWAYARAWLFDRLGSSDR